MIELIDLKAAAPSEALSAHLAEALDVFPALAIAVENDDLRAHGSHLYERAQAISIGLLRTGESYAARWEIGDGPEGDAERTSFGYKRIATNFALQRQVSHGFKRGLSHRFIGTRIAPDAAGGIQRFFENSADGIQTTRAPWAVSYTHLTLPTNREV